MAAPTYENPIYAAYLARYNIYDDTLPVMNKDALKEWQDFSSDLARYAKDKDAQGLKERIEDKKLRLGYIKASQDFKLGIEKIMSLDRQASLKAFVDRNNNLTNNSTKIATTNNQYNSRAFEPAKAAFSTAAGNTGAAASAEALFRTMTDRGIAYDASKPEVAGLATQWATMVLGKSDIQSVSPEEAAAKVKDAGGSESLQRQVYQLITVGKQADVAVRSAQKQIDDSADYAKRLSAQGGEVTQQQIDELGKKMVQAELGFQFLVGRSPEELSADVESLKSYDSQYQMMLEREKDLRRIAFGQGKEGLRSRMGRIVSDPDFQLWAKDNGYQLGQAMIDADGKVVYVPGPEDEKAILRFAYQARTGKQSPWPFASNDTGELVKVTITNDAERQRILERSDLGGGRYAINTDDNSLVDPKAYIETMKRDGFLDPQVEFAEHTAADGNTDHYFRAEGQTYKIDRETGNLVTVKSTDTLPKDLKFGPAVFYGDSDKAQHFLTVDELRAGKGGLFTESGEGEPRYGGLDADAQAAFDAASPYKVVGADQLKGLGVQTFEGMRDKRNARTMGQMGPGAFSINNGQFKFGEGAKYEVLLSDAEKTPGARRQARRARKAQRELEGVSAATGMSTERVLDFEAPIPAERPVAQPQLTALGERAMQGPATQARMEGLDRMGLATRDGTAAAPATTATAPAASAPRAEEDIFSGSSITLEPEGAEAAAAEPMFRKTDGSVVKMTRAGVEEVVPAPGKAPAAVIPADSDAYAAAADEILRTGTQVSAAEVKAAAKAPPTMVTAPPVGRRTPEVTAEGSGGEVTRIDYGARRPTLGQRISTELERFATTVGGAFRRRGAGGEDEGEEGTLPGETKEQADARRKAKAEAGTEEAVKLSPAAAAAATEAARNLGSEPRTFPKPEATGGVPSADIARKRGLDAQIMGFLLDKNVDPKVRDLAGRAQVLETRRIEADKARDLARRGLGPMPEFDADAYAAQVKALADEARERMRPRYGAQLSPFEPALGKVEGLGSNIEGETPVLQLPGTETAIPLSPFLQRAVESLGQRRQAQAQPERFAPPEVEPPATIGLVEEKQKTGPAFLRDQPPAGAKKAKAPAKKPPPAAPKKPATEEDLFSSTSIEMDPEQPNTPAVIPFSPDLGAGSYSLYGGAKPFSREEGRPLSTFQRLRQQAFSGGK